jgi:SAM-dependent methyltransferase
MSTINPMPPNIGSRGQASLEKLIESGVLKVPSLHPGGLELTRELAQLCKIGDGGAVLDLAAGTGETACFLAEQFGAHVIGVDLSEEMIRRAEAKARVRAPTLLKFQRADASHLPFADAAFDVAICECTLCLFDKEKVLSEMARVVKPGGRVGMHDLCWKESASEDLRRTLSEIEGEQPETLEGWSRLFRHAGLMNIIAVDKSDLIAAWMGESRKQLGQIGQAVLTLKIIRRWGIRGLWRVLRSERVFSSKHLGYGIVVGTRPAPGPQKRA